MWSCPNCGEPIGDEWGVCWICGTTAQGGKDPRFHSEPSVQEPAPDEDTSQFGPNRKVTVVFLVVLVGSLVVCRYFGGSIVTFLWLLVAGNLFGAGIGLVVNYLLGPQHDDEEEETAAAAR